MGLGEREILEVEAIILANVFCSMKSTVCNFYLCNSINGRQNESGCNSAGGRGMIMRWSTQSFSEFIFAVFVSLLL